MATVGPKKLYRSEKNQVLAGVSAGLGDYFEIDPVLIRIIFIFLTVFGGAGIPLYILLWLVLPAESRADQPTDKTVKANVEEIGQKAKNIAEDVETTYKGSNSKKWLGLILIFLGLIFFLDNFTFIRLQHFWPLILLVIGVSLLTKK